MAAISLPLGFFDLPECNTRASETIASWAALHAGGDAIIGLGGFLPFPGAATAAMAGALAAGIPIYKSLARDLRAIYEVPRDAIADRIVTGGIGVDAALTAAPHVAKGAAAATIDLADQFGMDFIWEIVSEIIAELGLGFIFGSLIPIVGGILSVGWDVAVAATMTWRVGTMVAIYYQHGGRWIGSRKETYERAKDMTGGLSPITVGRVDLNDIPKKNPEVNDYLVAQAVQQIKIFLELDPTTSDEKIRKVLRDQKVPEIIIASALAKINRNGRNNGPANGGNGERVP